MKKLFLLLLSVLLFVEISSQTLCEEVADAESSDDCRMHPTNIDNVHCCYVPDEDEDSKCWELTDDEYENIKRYIKFAKHYYSMDKLRIKCSANILSSSSLLILISLIGLLF